MSMCERSFTLVNDRSYFISRIYPHFLAVKRNVAASTQNQALNAIVFMYKHLLRMDTNNIGDYMRAKRSQKIPIVLTKEEANQLFKHLNGVYKLIAGLSYGSGLRIMECMRLRIKDVDFKYKCITVRDGKGQKDRVTMLSDKISLGLIDSSTKCRGDRVGRPHFQNYQENKNFQILQHQLPKQGRQRGE